jgi:hypothetical protein
MFTVLVFGVKNVKKIDMDKCFEKNSTKYALQNFDNFFYLLILYSSPDRSGISRFFFGNIADSGTKSELKNKTSASNKKDTETSSV